MQSLWFFSNSLGGDQDFFLKDWEAWNRWWGQFEAPGGNWKGSVFYCFHLLLALRHTLWGVDVYYAAFPSSLCGNVIAPPVQGLILEGLFSKIFTCCWSCGIHRAGCTFTALLFRLRCVELWLVQQNFAYIVAGSNPAQSGQCRRNDVCLPTWTSYRRNQQASLAALWGSAFWDN